MFEALLVVWIGAAQSQVMTAVRYESIAQCEEARNVIVKYIKDEAWRNTDYVKCLPVKKVEK